MAILSPILAHTGFVNSTRTLCYLTDITLAPRDWLPTLIMSISSALKELTLLSLCPSSLDAVYLTPRSLFSKKYETSISLSTSGIYPGWPIICPTKESALVINGSTLIPTPISPPGTAYIRAFLSAFSDVICDSISLHWTAPVLWFLVISPGLIEILSPTLSTPRRMVPPATPPKSFSAWVPG